MEARLKAWRTGALLAHKRGDAPISNNRFERSRATPECLSDEIGNLVGPAEKFRHGFTLASGGVLGTRMDYADEDRTGYGGAGRMGAGMRAPSFKLVV